MQFRKLTHITHWGRTSGTGEPAAAPQAQPAPSSPRDAGAPAARTSTSTGLARRRAPPPQAGATAPSPVGANGLPAPSTPALARPAPAAPASPAARGHGALRMASLGKLLGRAPPQAPRVLAEMDIAGRAGAHLRRIDAHGRETAFVPPMSLRIEIADPKLLAAYDSGGENVALLQRIQVAAYEAMNEASREIERFARDFAARHGQVPQMPAAQRQQFEKMCAAIVEAQQARVQQLVAREVDVERRRDASKFSSDTRFAFKVVLNVVAIAASVSTMATVGIAASPLQAAMAGWRLQQLHACIGKYRQDRAKLAESVVKNDKELVQFYSEPKRARSSFRARLFGRELGTALGIQGMSKSVRKQRNRLREFDARTVRFRNELGTEYAKAEAQRAHIEEASRREDLSAQDKAALEQAGAEHAKLMDGIVSMMQTLAEDNRLLEKYTARCDDFERHHAPGLDQLADFAEIGTDARRIGMLISNLQALAGNAASLAA